ncbi:hypothetical protein BGZ99_001181 [Dissophora globulifera]|uniref:BZIP domain-containing protein n=1 Tax=Dissophora globulifera TaxID=979702 RepID=A0A9P6UKL4_9FUNG|nr:hypothetical protein BGZ99_001181 [Dissophora globulifera]
MSASPPPSSSSPSLKAAHGAGPYDSSATAAPLSPSDRRERNKAASAKYRAKKHNQSGEMRSQISTLQDQTNVLSRQLEECRAENASLKNLVEKLKGRLVAEKVLKRLREVGREKKRRGDSRGHGRVSAQDLSVSDSDTDDMVDAVEEELEEDDEDDEEMQAAPVAVATGKRPSERRTQSRRKAARTEEDDADYREA